MLIASASGRPVTWSSNRRPHRSSVAAAKRCATTIHARKSRARSRTGSSSSFRHRSRHRSQYRHHDGAGRRQYQIPSPLEVFFPNNDLVRQTWTPLFALYRYDQRAPGNARTSLLWDGITWEHNDAEQRAEFHLGPIFSVQRKPGERRIAIGNGLFGAKRLAGEHSWRLFWLDFSSKPVKVPSAESATR